ncbi:radical SAM protein [Streptomyces jumonjinensis]|uniref:radical SAM protein n=2 Tax=Streptomyces jumonjinensis TaxID=1945 RepID=UPI00331BF23C
MSAAVLPPTSTLGFAWLEVTGFCNLECTHCYADSSPKGTHGTMTPGDWKSAIDQLADLGTESIQFIGGEPCLYPHLAELIAHARGRRIGVEVYSNLTHVSDSLWTCFTEHRVDLATSYYSDQAAEHDAVTARRGSHTRTRANIEKAQVLGLNLRGGIVQVRQDQRVEEAHQDLKDLGLRSVDTDRQRAFGRASLGAVPAVEDLCGHCGRGKLAIGPDGDVWPCVLSRFINVGNVRTAALTAIWGGSAMARAKARIDAVHGDGTQACTPPQFLPFCAPCQPCPPMFSHCDPETADTPQQG